MAEMSILESMVTVFCVLCSEFCLHPGPSFTRLKKAQWAGHSWAGRPAPLPPQPATTATLGVDTVDI